MATAQSKLDILINAKQQGSGIKQTTMDLKGLDNAAGGLAKGLGGLAAGAGVAGVVALGTAAVGAAFDMSRLAAQSSDVEASMQSLAANGGGSAESMLASLKEASRGAISDYDLMLTANKAMLLGVASNSQQMGDLMDVARARSQAMGLTTAQAFSDLTTGIARLSPMILDNLGISIDAEKAQQAYAASIGKTAAQLTEQEKKQALVNAVLRESADLVKDNEAAGDDAASNFERMDASISNAKDALGELFSPAVVVVAKAIADAAGAAAEGMKELKESGDLSQLAFNAENSAGIILGLTRELEFLRQEEELLAAAHQKGSADWIDLQADIRATEERLRTAQQATLEYNRAMLVASAGASDLNHAQIEAGLSMYNLAAAAPIAAAGFVDMDLKASNLERRLAGLKAQSDATAAALAGIKSSALGQLESAATGAVRSGAMSASEAARLYGPAAEQLNKQIKTLRQVGMTEDEIKFKSIELANNLGLVFTDASDNLAQAERDAKSYAKTLSGDLSDAAKEAERAFEDLKGRVAGVLSQSLNHGTGVDPDEVLEAMGIPRADAINENARRLADIAANGLKNQDWLGAFRNEVPDIWNMIRTASNPQEEAAFLLRDFQDGLLTSAIDKDKAKQLVKRMLMGEANMAELATEIATELSAEMGVPLQQAMAAAQGALGVGGATGTAGTEAAQSFTDGAVAHMTGGGGAAMVDEFIVQAKAQFSKLKAAGNDAGKTWAAGFMETVGSSIPPQLIDVLVNLTAPGVMAAIAQRGTQTGAP